MQEGKEEEATDLLRVQEDVDFVFDDADVLDTCNRSL